MGARLTTNGTERVYAAARRWTEVALRTDCSLFTPDRQIWTSQGLGELHRRFLNNPDERRGGFLDKLERQLEGSQPEVYQLIAEVLYVYFLIVKTRNSANEQQKIDTVLQWSESHVEIPPDLVAALTPGIANPGTGFHTYRPYQVGLLIEFVQQWKEQDREERDRMLGDPWAFKEFLMGVRLHSRLLRDNQNTPRIQRQALLHLVYPDTFEAIVNADHKDQIARAFEANVTETTGDVDRKLGQIRTALEAQYASGDYFFYQPEIRSQWDDQYEGDLWGSFVERARRYMGSGRLAPDEVDYKIEIGGKLAEARESVLTSAEDWDGKVKVGIAGNLIYPIGQSKFRDWIDHYPSDALFALQVLWTGNDESVYECVSDFSELLPRSVSSGGGTRTTLISVLLMGLDVKQYPPFMITVFYKAFELTGYPAPVDGDGEADLYDHALNFLDRFIEEALARELTINNRLEAQSLVWTITQGLDQVKEPDEGGHKPHPDDPWSSAKLAELAQDLLWEPDYLEKIIYGLKDKGQVILQGPPGTGKTYVARQIAEWCRTHGGDYQVVQFHPSYSYENFVEGFRPTAPERDRAGFTLTDGPLKAIAKKAAANPDATFILVIDEINRGNVGKVLGELYFLLEYRDEEVTLQYSSKGFRLPKNLWFIGTMNTTDQSIALVDAALRRRFYFFGFFPDQPPIRGLLDRWIEEYDSEAGWVARLVDSANRILKDRHMGIGPSHFMKKEVPLDKRRVRFIWEQAVIPYIEEQFFGNEEELKRFDFDQLMRSLEEAQPDSEAGQNEDGTPTEVDNSTQNPGPT